MERIGRYELLRPIGAGPNGTVHLGADPFTQQEIAVKRLHPEFGHDSAHGALYRHQFLGEAGLAAKLAHPHIARVLDAGRDGDDAYAVMEYVPGGSLAAFSAPDALLPPARLAELAFKCARALDHAYLQGVTHRDLKPSNLLLPDPGRTELRVADFGAALLSASEAAARGGPAALEFLAPEQLRETPLDHRADIWSLGAVLYRLLTGEAAFAGDTPAARLDAISRGIPRPARLRPGIGAEFDAIVVRALQPGLDERYASWAEFSHDLALAARTLAPPDGVPGDSVRFERLRGFRFFSEFDDAELWEVLRFAHWETPAEGVPVMREGEPGNHFCFVLDGTLEVVKGGRRLTVLGPGDCFGEMALFSAGRGARSASVATITPAALLTVRAQDLQRASAVCQMHFYKAFLDVLAQRLSQANSRLADRP